jgi:hypothetical protein
MDYLTLKQAKDLIPQIESAVFMKWIANNKSRTKDEGINLLIEKGWFYQAFKLQEQKTQVEETATSTQTIGDKQPSVVKPPDPMQATTEIFNPPKNAELEPLNKLYDDLLSEKVSIKDFYDNIILESKNKYDDFINGVELYFNEKQAELAEVVRASLGLSNKIIADADAYKKERVDKVEAELLGKVSELNEMSGKLGEALKLYDELKTELSNWHILVEKRVEEYKNGKTDWHIKAVKWLEYQNKIVEKAIK